MKLTIQQMQQNVYEMLQATIQVCEKNDITYYAQAGTVLGAIRHQGFIPWDGDADLIIPNDQIDRFVACAQRDLPKKFYVDYFKINKKALRQFPRIGMAGFTTNQMHVDIFRLIGLPDDRETQLQMIEEARSYTKQVAAIRYPLWRYLKQMQFREAFLCLKQRIVDRELSIRAFDALCSRYAYASAQFVMNPSGKYGQKNIFRKEIYGVGLMKPFIDTPIRIPSEYDFYLKQYYADYMKTPDQDSIDAAMNKTYVVR